MKKQVVYKTKPLEASLKSIIKREKSKKVLLVTGKGSYECSGAKTAMSDILKDLNVCLFQDFSPNPNINEVKRGVKKIREFKPDIIIAVGGGSAIDIAKSIAILSKQTTDKFETFVKGEKALLNKCVDLIAIPTTAGTGAETTHFAVVYIGKEKYSLAAQCMRPKYVVLDPQLTYSLPSYITASTGIDALSQAIEAHWSVQSTSQSRKHSMRAMKLAMANIEAATHKNSKKARSNMLEAAFQSGMAINIAKTTAAHAMSYALTSYYGISHGHAVGISIPSLIRFNGNITKKTTADKRGCAFVKKRIEEIVHALNAKTSEGAAKKFQKLMESLGLEKSLRKLKIPQNDIVRLASKVSAQRAKNNPRAFTEKEALEIYKENL